MSASVALGDASWSDDAQDGSTRAVIYLRVSTKEQAEKGGEAEGYSIPAQREVCKRRAESLGAVVVEEFVDRGESAKTSQRPELQRMLAYLRDNPTSLVIVHKIDRLARNRVDDVEITLAIRAASATLVSCSENIDETPSGALLHGIMSSIAEFYSRNLANEVIKGSLQKAKSGGTIGKAPIGYLNTRTIENGREVRTVEIDPLRAPLMQWAFEAYATGRWALTSLLEELTRRGLTSVETAKRPAQPLQRSHLHKLLCHPYYKGVVRYRGVEYPGRHEPLVSPELWQRVQDILRARYHAEERQRRHNHYLKGSLFCGNCGSRMIVCNARSRSGQIYPYFVCLGRHQKRTTCTFRAVRIETVEEKVAEHYGDCQLKPELRDLLHEVLRDEIASQGRAARMEQIILKRRQRRLLDERAKLLQAHYAGAVPLEQLKAEQDRITTQLTQISARLVLSDQQQTTVETNLKAALDLAADCQAAYGAAGSTVKRQLNQAFFTKLIVNHDETIASDLAEPFDTLLDEGFHAQAKIAARTKPSPEAAEFDWDALEASWNDNTPGIEDPEGDTGLGLNKAILVGAGGFEPP